MQSAGGLHPLQAHSGIQQDRLPVCHRAVVYTINCHIKVGNHNGSLNSTNKRRIENVIQSCLVNLTPTTLLLSFSFINSNRVFYFLIISSFSPSVLLLSVKLGLTAIFHIKSQPIKGELKKLAHQPHPSTQTGTVPVWFWFWSAPTHHLFSVTGHVHMPTSGFSHSVLRWNHASLGSSSLGGVHITQTLGDIPMSMLDQAITLLAIWELRMSSSLCGLANIFTYIFESAQSQLLSMTTNYNYCNYHLVDTFSINSLITFLIMSVTA